ncbi:MAG: tyrosine--tRNA ligase [Candidatus Limnocylindrales bacterium]|nr:tyrosine--tRNA ligase [Candidatus Limnocylindrales bacterium]
MSGSRLAGLLPDLRWRGLVHATTEGLEARLATGAPLRAYNGFDPTFRSLHVGHLIPIFGLVRLQRFGAQPVAVVGGGTGLIGDPSGRSAERPLLDRPAIQANVHAIRDQLAHYLDFAPGPTQALLVNNLDWLGELRLLDFLRDVGKHFTVPYMLAKDSVTVRMDRGLSFTEFSYMLLQAADFQHLHRSYGVELQCGGADQWGNITAGLELIRRTAGPRRPDADAASEPAHGLAYPLLLNPSGAKFGKSESGESIWLDPALTSPYRFYQYWLDAEDRDIGTYLRWFTLFDRARIEELEAEQAAHPEQHAAQRALARDLTERTHGRGAAERVVRVSELLFGGDPAAADAQTLTDLAAEIPAAAWPESEPGADEHPGLDLVDVLVLAGTASSRGEARRLVEQGGVHVNGRPAQDLEQRFTTADLLAGRFLLIRRGKRDQRVLVRGPGKG